MPEDVRYYQDEVPFTGMLSIVDGDLTTDLSVRGKSLVHSVDLTTIAFTRGAFGDFGKYIVAIGLVLFAFSTAVAWSYYGDRAITYLFGVKGVLPYRMVYVLGFFVAAIADTSLVWLISAITIAFMTIPNLFAIVMLRKEMKDIIEQYWQKFKEEHPDG
jgi:AGCS family alanine or glycine:cation symporter